MEKITINMQEEPKSRNFLEKIPFILLSALVFLLPVFFITSPLLSFTYSKVIILSIVVLLCLFAWTITSFKEGKLILPTSWFILSLFAIPLVFLIAALFSPNRNVSLIGSGLEVGTFSFILLLSLLTFLISTFVRSKEKIFYCYLWFGAGFLVVAIYQTLHLFFGPNFLSFNYFTDVISNPVGKWNDMAVFAGAVTLFSLISLELLVLSQRLKTLLYVVLILSLFLLAVANFTIIWATPITIITLIGFFALLFFVYFISSNQGQSTEASSSRRIPVPSLIVLIFAVVFTLAAGPIGGSLVSYFKINTLDVSPTWQSTIEVAKGALSRNAALGVGPNRFEREWNLSKPDGVNVTDFWNTDFNYGVGIIPTFLITTGIIGLLVWIVFLGFLIYLGGKAVFSRVRDQFSLYLILSSFFVSIYLWIVNILYVPGLVIFSFAFIFSGLFLASLFREGILKEKAIFYVQDSRKGFAVILLLVVIMIGAITWGYFIAEKVLASIYANQALRALNAQDVQGAENYAVRAIGADQNPLYYRFLSQIEVSRAGSFIQQNDLNSDTVKVQLQGILNNAVSAASTASTLDPTDYQNWLSLGNVYENVIPLGLQDAASQATSAYQEALKRNPQNPGIYLAMARVEAANKNYVKAKEHIVEALRLKNNYLDAIYFLSQIDLAEKNSAAAVADLEAAAIVAPNNPSVYFQLGALNYSLERYQAAAAAFTQAITLVPNYADAKYYLGLSYYKLGRKDDAIKQFQDLLTANPGNQVVSDILSNLQAGRDPFNQVSTSTPQS